MNKEYLITIILTFFLIIFFILRSRYTSHYKKFTFRTTIKYFVIGGVMIMYFLNWFSIGTFNLAYTLRIIIGFPIFILGSIIFFWAHHHLGKNWSPIIEKKFSKSKTLIIKGPYRYIRHPIYSSSFIILIGTLIVTANWLFTGLLLILLTLFYFYKVPREERELLDNFGKKYQDYKYKTGGLIPKLW